MIDHKQCWSVRESNFLKLKVFSYFISNGKPYNVTYAWVNVELLASQSKYFKVGVDPKYISVIEA